MPRRGASVKKAKGALVFVEGVSRTVEFAGHTLHGTVEDAFGAGLASGSMSMTPMVSLKYSAT